MLNPDKKAIPTLKAVYEPGPVLVTNSFNFLFKENFFMVSKSYFFWSEMT